MQFGVREISPSSVAKVLGMMARTPTGLDGQNMQQAHVRIYCISNERNL